jgi:Sulfatase
MYFVPSFRENRRTFSHRQRLGRSGIDVRLFDVGRESARLFTGRRVPFLRFVHRTFPLLVVAMVAIMSVSFRPGLVGVPRVATLPSPPVDARNVFLIVWDTVRTGNLSVHSYGRKTSPNLEQLASRGVRFDQTFATASWTCPRTAASSPGGGYAN